MDSRWSAMSWIEFPFRYEIGRTSGEQVMPLIPEFIEAVRKTRTRFWVIDSHFFAPDTTNNNPNAVRQYYGLVAEILLVVADNGPEVDIRILTSNDDHLNEFWKFVQGALGDSADSPEYKKFKERVKVSAELRRNAPAIHDRFAILDDTLWHFGAKVAGLHPALSANSGAWNAEVHGALGFFEKLWDRVGR